MPKDLLDELVAQIRAAVPELAPDRADAIARKIRHDWGGAKTYIRKHDSQGKVVRLASALAAGRPLREAFDTAGVSRATGFRMLSRRRAAG